MNLNEEFLQSGRPQSHWYCITEPTSPYAIISESDHICKDTVTIGFGLGITKAPTVEKSNQHKTKSHASVVSDIT